MISIAYEDHDLNPNRNVKCHIKNDKNIELCLRLISSDCSNHLSLHVGKEQSAFCLIIYVRVPEDSGVMNTSRPSNIDVCETTRSSDRGCISLLVLLDLSAAFDTIDHNILLNRLENFVGISGSALAWFKSYLSDRHQFQFVAVNEEVSYRSQVQYGVPQGSVLGPLLFTLYMLPLGNIIRKHGVSFHCYADDTQLYISSRPGETHQIEKLMECIVDIKNWMTSNFLLLNSEKTEVLIIGPKTPTSNNLEHCLTLDGCSVNSSSSVRNLGVLFNSNLSFDSHVSSICKTAFFHLKNISKLRPMLSMSNAEILIHAFMTSRLDYCNALLGGCSARLINKLQMVQNAAARVLTRTRKYEHISPVLSTLHWLPTKHRIDFKILLITYKALNGLAPQYLSSYRIIVLHVCCVLKTLAI